jgi:hypothetical protein
VGFRRLMDHAVVFRFEGGKPSRIGGHRSWIQRDRHKNND